MQLYVESVIPAFYRISKSCLDPSGKWRHFKKIFGWSEGGRAFDHMRGLTRFVNGAEEKLSGNEPRF